MGDMSFNGLITDASATFSSLLKFMAFGIKWIAEANDLLSRLCLGGGKAALILKLPLPSQIWFGIPKGSLLPFMLGPFHHVHFFLFLLSYCKTSRRGKDCLLQASPLCRGLLG